MEGPDSSYSSLEIHICWKVDNEARIDPPIQTEYFRSGGATILTFMEDGARAVISFCMRSDMPGYMVVPPDCAIVSRRDTIQREVHTMTMLLYKSFRTSTSHLMMELKTVACTPASSKPRTEGWKRASGALNRSFPIVMTCPSGSS